MAPREMFSYRGDIDFTMCDCVIDLSTVICPIEPLRKLHEIPFLTRLPEAIENIINFVTPITLISQNLYSRREKKTRNRNAS